MTLGASAKASLSESVENIVHEEDGAADLETKLPLHDDIMQLARLGEIGPIQKLFEEGRYSTTYKDEDGITPLHVSLHAPHAVCLLTNLVGSDQ